MRMRLTARKNDYFNLSIAALVFVVVIGLSYGAFYAPILYSDDWSHIVEGLAGNRWRFIDLSSRRPLVHAPILLVYSIFGLNIHVFYLVLVLCQWVSAVGMHCLLGKINLDSLLTLLLVLLFLVYPADYSRMWLNMLHVRFVYVLLVVYAWSLFIYQDRNHIAALVVALLCLLISLGIYEAHLGVALGWAILMFFRSKRLSLPRKLGVLSPFILAVAFSLWRTYGIGRAGVHDNYLELVQLAPSMLLSRLVAGFKVLIWAWIEPFRQAFGGGPDLAFTYSSNWRYYLVIAGVIALGWIGVMLLGRKGSFEDVLSRDDRLREIHLAALLFLVGGLFVIAGYLPIVTVYMPNLVQHDSRANLFALPGASLCFVALFYMTSILLTRHRKQVRELLIVSVIPLLIIGAVTQVWIQHDAQVAWEDQKAIWARLFELVPDAVDGTQMLLVLPGYQECTGLVNWNRTPVSAQWEVRSAIRVLYGNATLSGDVFFPDLCSRVELRQDGVVSLWTQDVTPYAEIVVLVYDGGTRQLRLAENLQDDLGLKWPTPDYDPWARVLSSTKSSIELRRLVE